MIAFILAWTAISIPLGIVVGMFIRAGRGPDDDYSDPASWGDQ